MIQIISKMFSTILNGFKTSMLLIEVSMLKNELKLKNKLIEDLNFKLKLYLEKEKRDKESNEASRIMMEDWFNKKIYMES
jgi:predicted tellurium resistance membrane protein TerC